MQHSITDNIKLIIIILLHLILCISAMKVSHFVLLVIQSAAGLNTFNRLAKWKKRHGMGTRPTPRRSRFSSMLKKRIKQADFCTATLCIKQPCVAKYGYNSRFEPSVTSRCHGDSQTLYTLCCT